MADFSALKTAIQANIRTNANEEITGAILQEILLSMVTTMGDGAINGLVTALQEEVVARQNAVGGEATARQDADSALSGRINGEATARGEADTLLQNAINGITTRLNEGYVYVGIATPSTNPGTPAGHVFYIALQAGTYTNFSSLVVTQGINILKYNGTAWLQEQLCGIDDVPTAGSNNLVKSGGVAFDIKTLANTFIGYGTFGSTPLKWIGPLDNSNQHLVIDVSGFNGKNIVIERSGSIAGGRMAFVQSYETPVVDAQLDIVAGTSLVGVDQGRSVVQIPSGTKYIILQKINLEFF